MNRCLECGIGAGEKIIYNVRCEHYKLFFLFLIKLAALGAFFRKPTSPPLNLKRSSKTHQSSLNLKGGSTAFPKPLFAWRRLAALGIVQASLTLLSFAQPFPSGYRGCTNRPTRCSNRFAIRLADHQRSTPAAELRFFVRDGTAWTQGIWL